MSFGVGNSNSDTRHRQEHIFCQWISMISWYFHAYRSSDSHTKIWQTYKKGHQLSPIWLELCTSGNTPVIRQSCRKPGGQGVMEPPRFWQIINPIPNRGQIVQTTLLLDPRIFRPSYGPVRHLEKNWAKENNKVKEWIGIIVNFF